MSNFSRIEPAYTSKNDCRLIWQGSNGDEHAVILEKNEIDTLVDILKKDSTGKVELSDQFSQVLINSDVTQFRLQSGVTFEVSTSVLKKYVLEYLEIAHEPQYVRMYSKEFYPSIEIQSEPTQKSEKLSSKSNSILDAILSEKLSKTQSDSDLFKVMSNRRSTRKFDKSRFVESWKVDKILAAADTAPTAGNFQGFEVFYVKDKKAKEALIEAANKQSFVNAPVVLIFCTNPSRVKINFPKDILEKFSLQDATLAAAYSQLAASALGLSSIWIGMIDEEKIKKILNTELRPSSILCIGYPITKRPPKSRRNLKDLIHVLDSV